MVKKRNVMNILIACNSRYIKPYIVALASLFKNNKNISFNIYYAYYSVDDVDNVVHLLEKKIKKHAKLIRVPVHHYPSEKLVSYLGPYKPIVYLKLFSLYYLDEKIDKILWLDGDVLVCKNVLDFYKSFDINKYAIKGTEEIEEENILLIEAISGVNISPQYDLKYLNVGVLLINPKWFLDRWSNASELDRFLSSIDLSKKSYLLPEQDLINIICSHYKQIALGSLYNYSIDTEKNYYTIKYRSIYIIHFTQTKPWTIYDKSVRFYFRYWRYGIFVYSAYRFFKIFGSMISNYLKLSKKK